MPAQFYFGFRKLFFTFYLTMGTGNSIGDCDLKIMSVTDYKAQNVHADVIQQDKEKPILIITETCIIKHFCDICFKYAK